MSFQTWINEFYPTPVKGPHGLTAKTPLESVRQSLLKWKGIKKANLQKHGCEVFMGHFHASVPVIREIGFDDLYLPLNYDSCSLCVRCGTGCNGCPLNEVEKGKKCADGSAYMYWRSSNNPLPLIRALERAEKQVAKACATPYAVVIDKDALSVTHVTKENAIGAKCVVVPNADWLLRLENLLAEAQSSRDDYEAQIATLVEDASYGTV